MLWGISRSKDFSETNCVLDPVLPRNSHFYPFFLTYHGLCIQNDQILFKSFISQILESGFSVKIPVFISSPFLIAMNFYSLFRLVISLHLQR